jgi:hypothetical protein
VVRVPRFARAASDQELESSLSTGLGTEVNGRPAVFKRVLDGTFPRPMLNDNQTNHQCHQSQP